MSNETVFPRASHTSESQTGISLRDYFAAKAMQGLLAQSGGSALVSEYGIGAAFAYSMADAMLAARESK